MPLGKRVRLPLTSTRRGQPTYIKLLERFDPHSRSPFAWRGRFLRPGTTIHESALWPDGPFPRKPLLVEYAGAENPLKGHNRHKCDETAVLWRYSRETGEFVEIGRVVAPAGLWTRLLEPLIREAMAQEAGYSGPADLTAICGRIARVIYAELDRVSDVDRERVMTALHDEIASRIAQWTRTEGEATSVTFRC